MAARLTIEPAALVTAYRPVLFQYQVDADSRGEIERLVVFVFINSSQDAFNERQELYFTPYLFQGDKYTFNVDISSVLQDYFFSKINTISNTFEGIGTGGVFYNQDCFCFYELRFIAYYRDEDNILVPLGDSVLESTKKYAFAAIPQNQDDVTLSQYIFDLQSRVPCKLLTDAPLLQEIASDDDFAVSFVALDIDYARIVLSYEDRDNKTFDIQVNPNLDYSVVTVFISPKNLANQSEYIYDEFVFEAPVEDDFIGVTSLSFTGISRDIFEIESAILATETINLVVNNNCNDRKRLYWLNRFGVVDQYTFDGQWVVEQVVSSNSIRIPLTWQQFFQTPHQPYFRGNVKNKINSLKNLRIATQLDFETLAWVSWILSSSEVYLFENDKLISALVEDSTQELEKRFDGRSDFELSLIIQNNITHV